MDNRLSLIQGKRPTKIRSDDLDDLARVLVAVLRGRGEAGLFRKNGVEGVILRTRDDLPRCPNTTNVRTTFILKSDWEKIQPFIDEGFFQTLLYPTGARGQLRVKVAFSEGLLDQADGQQPDGNLYQRVLNTLKLLFTESYPTSNI